MIQTRLMLNMITQVARGKVKRLIKEGLRDDKEIILRTMESVNKPQVMAQLKAVGLDDAVVELRIKEITEHELKQSTNIKGNTNPNSPLNEYNKLKVALLSGRRSIAYFKSDTFKQLRIEAGHEKEIHGNNATKILMDRITGDKQYMEILSIAKISEQEIRDVIELVVKGSDSAEQIEKKIAGLD